MGKSHPGVWVYSTDHRRKALSSFTLNSAISSSLIKTPAFVFVFYILYVFVLGNNFLTYFQVLVICSH